MTPIATTTPKNLKRTNFIQRLTAADGVLEVEGGYSHSAANDALIRDVMKPALRPKGYKLEITSVGRGRAQCTKRVGPAISLIMSTSLRSRFRTRWANIAR
jgi:hypothetical protein